MISQLHLTNDSPLFDMRTNDSKSRCVSSNSCRLRDVNNCNANSINEGNSRAFKKSYKGALNFAYAIPKAHSGEEKFKSVDTKKAKSVSSDKPLKKSISKKLTTSNSTSKIICHTAGLIFKSQEFRLNIRSQVTQSLNNINGAPIAKRSSLESQDYGPISLEEECQLASMHISSKRNELANLLSTKKKLEQSIIDLREKVFKKQQRKMRNLINPKLYQIKKSECQKARYNEVDHTELEKETQYLEDDLKMLNCENNLLETRNNEESELIILIKQDASKLTKEICIAVVCSIYYIQ